MTAASTCLIAPPSLHQSIELQLRARSRRCKSEFVVHLDFTVLTPVGHSNGIAVSFRNLE